MLKFSHIPFLFAYFVDLHISAPQTFHLDFEIENRAGKRVTVVWRDDIREIDVDDGSMGQFSYVIKTSVVPLPRYKFTAVRYGTNISQLVNKQLYYETNAVAETGATPKIVVTSSKYLT